MARPKNFSTGARIDFLSTTLPILHVACLIRYIDLLSKLIPKLGQ